MKDTLLLNIVVSQSAAILQLLAGKNQTLLIGRASPPIPFGIGLDYTLSHLRLATVFISNRKPSSL